MNIATCAFIPLSATGLSAEGKQEILQSNNFTLGDANRTLYTIERIRKGLTFVDDADNIVLQMLENQFGPLMYIDLEN